MTLNSEYVKWIPVTQSDATANDNDKSFTVPAGKNWMLQGIHVSLVSSSDAGNRRVAVEIQGVNSTVYQEVVVGAVQTASLTRRYDLNPGAVDATTFRSTLLTTPINPFILDQSWKIRVYDLADISSSADDMTVRISALERSSTD